MTERDSFIYGMESIKEYIDQKLDKAIAEIKRDLSARELNIIAGFQKDFQNMDISVKELLFEHIPSITRFLSLIQDIKLSEMKYCAERMPIWKGK
jgi:hypothetical protein